MKAKHKSPRNSPHSPPDPWRKQAEEKHQAMLETALDGFWVADRNGRLLEVNDSYCKMVGYSREELLTMSIPDIEAAETPEETAQHIEEVMERGHDYFQTRHRRKDGKIIDVEVSVNYIGVEGGQLFAFVRDSTGRRRAEQALSESEAKYRTLVENIPRRIFLKDKNSVYLSCNKNYAQYLNIKPKEIAGHTDYDFYPQELAERYRASDRRVLESGETDTIEERYTQGGQERVAETFKSPVRDESGQLVGVLGICHDITKRKKAEQALRESEEKYRTLAENIPQRIFLKDKNSVYLSCNSNYAKDMGIKPEEIAGHTDYDFYPGDLAEKYRADDRRVIESGNIERVEERYIHHGQERVVETFKTPVRDENGQLVGILGIFHDITEQRHMERQRRDQEIAEVRAEELSKSRQRLLSAQESLRKEIAGHLHGTVQSRLILLGQKLAELEARPASERTTEELADMRRKVEELQNDHIRPISHRLFPSVLRLGLAAGLESLVDEYHTKLHIDLQVSQQLRDKEQVNRRFIPDNVKLALYRIAEEALANIVKHTPPVENVVVKLSPSNSRALRLAVSDDGAGFHEAGLSTGIGLAIMSDYAAAAGGSCAIKSIPGKGTRVTAEVPLVALEGQ